MNRIEKTNYINSLKKDLETNDAMMIYHYEGLNVKQLDELRDKMREAGALLKVTKNRITKLALKETTHSEAENLFSGPTAIALSQDPISIAKTPNINPNGTTGIIKGLTSIIPFMKILSLLFILFKSFY